MPAPARCFRTRLEQAARGAHHLERPDGVDAKQPLKILQRQSVEIAMGDVLGRAGIVDQRIEAAPVLDGRHDPAAVLVARDVALRDHDFRGARPAAGLSSSLGLVLAGGIVDDQPRSGLRENFRGRRTKAGCGPRHDCAQVILSHPDFLSLCRILASCLARLPSPAYRPKLH
jgi:hypothetical protein